MMRNQAWKQIPNLHPESRHSHTSTLVQDYIITYGGKSDNSYPQIWRDIHIQVLNLKTFSFEDFFIEGDQPCQRAEHTACAFDQNKILIFGGHDENYNVLNDTSVISIELTTPLMLKYKKLNTTNGKDLKRCQHSADIHGHRMYVFGGEKSYPNFGRNNRSNELWCLDLNTFAWQFCETKGTKPGNVSNSFCLNFSKEEVAGHSSTIKNDKLYIFGGSQKNAMQHYYVLSLGTMKWEKCPVKEGNIPSKFGSFSACCGDNFFIISGRKTRDDHRDGIITYNFKEDSFTEIEIKEDHFPIFYGAAVIYKDSLIIWGGLSGEAEKCLPAILCLQLDDQKQPQGGNLYEGKAKSFADEIKGLLGSEMYSDICLVVEGEKIPAHKLVLGLRCQFFQNLFTSDMIVSRAKEIEIKDVKLQTFKALLRFLYQNVVELTVSLAMDLYEVSDKYLQKDLAALCEDFLSKNLTLDNFLSMIDFAEKFGILSLKQAILRFIANNLQKIKQSQSDFLIPYPYLMEVASKFQEELVRMGKKIEKNKSHLSK